MTLITYLLAGLLAGLLVSRALLPSMQRSPFLVENFRKDKIPVATGLVIVVAVLAVLAVVALLDTGIGIDPTHRIFVGATLIFVSTFALFGLLDDLAAADGDRGFKGHVRALAKGKLSTGSLKLFGGAFVALTVVDGTNIGMHIVNAAVVALSANLTNLFDLRPGRTLKVSTLWAALLFCLSGMNAELAPIAIVVGASLALFHKDLKARLMLGDTGANILGAVLGFGVLIVSDDWFHIAFLGFLVAMTLVGDLVGFTKIINKVPPLRFLDNLGRK